MPLESPRALLGAEGPPVVIRRCLNVLRDGVFHFPSCEHLHRLPERPFSDSLPLTVTPAARPHAQRDLIAEIRGVGAAATPSLSAKEAMRTYPMVILIAAACMAVTGCGTLTRAPDQPAERPLAESQGLIPVLQLGDLQALKATRVRLSRLGYVARVGPFSELSQAQYQDWMTPANGGYLFYLEQPRSTPTQCAAVAAGRLASGARSGAGRFCRQHCSGSRRSRILMSRTATRSAAP